MSGFLAIINLDGETPDTELVQRLTARLAYRGPDRTAVRVEGCAAMGHALFRTSNEARYDRQPSSLNSNTWIVSSARVDARAELRNRLPYGRETRLDQTPDAELILRAYDAWGVECPARFLGDFAFAIWDEEKRRLTCARDRFGVRQLYYAHAGRSFVVTNSMYCLLGHPEISRKLNDDAIGAFLLFGDHTWYDKSITAFSNISALPPAHFLVFQKGALDVRRYWSFPVEVRIAHYRREAEYLDRFRVLFEQALADRVRGQSTVIAQSGGMDSSSMAATVIRLNQRSSRQHRLHGVSVVYDRVHPSDERRYTRLIADHLGLAVQFIAADAYPLLQPTIATTRPVELYNPAVWVDMYRAAAEYGRVILEGEAGDSLFQYSAGRGCLKGVNWLRILFETVRLRLRYGQRPALGTGLMTKIKRPGGNAPKSTPQQPFPYPTWLNRSFERRLGLQQRWRERMDWQLTNGNPRHPEMHAALIAPDWNTDDLYLRTSFTLPEICDPFLDHRLIEYALSLPPLPWLYRKHLLRRMMAAELPQETLRRPKTPLGMLHESLLRQPEAQWIAHWTPGRAVLEYIDPGQISDLLGSGDSLRTYVDLRPVLLDKWLTALSQVS